jgi:hypothetical protein
MDNLSMWAVWLRRGGRWGRSGAGDTLGAINRAAIPPLAVAALGSGAGAAEPTGGRRPRVTGWLLFRPLWTAISVRAGQYLSNHPLRNVAPEIRQLGASGAMGCLPAWAMWTVIAAGVLLSPVLAFLLAIAVEIVLGVLQDAGVLKFVALVAAGAVGWSWCCKLWVRACGRARAET